MNGVLGPPKTKKSRARRRAQALLDDLNVYRAMYPPVGDGFVFREERGMPLDPGTWHKRRLPKIAKAAGLTVRRFGLHTLRHSYCTMLLDTGMVNLKYISTELGHSSISITADLYTHALKERSEADMTALTSW